MRLCAECGHVGRAVLIFYWGGYRKDSVKLFRGLWRTVDYLGDRPVGVLGSVTFLVELGSFGIGLSLRKTSLLGFCALSVEFCRVWV